ncbi:MAG: hypothetical protein EPO32_14685 [Anaerolineae bacterium]|nr:MAG: hypothetical protein EPO32_14685 [Anaerolineae bacterium]
MKVFTDDEILKALEEFTEDDRRLGLDPAKTLAGQAAALIRRLQSELLRLRDLAPPDPASSGFVFSFQQPETETIRDRDARAAMQTILQTEWPAMDRAASSDNCNTDAAAVSLTLAIVSAWQMADLMAKERARRNGGK